MGALDVRPRPGFGENGRGFRRYGVFLLNSPMSVICEVGVSSSCTG